MLFQIFSFIKSAKGLVSVLGVVLGSQALACADQFIMRDGRIVTGNLVSTRKIDKVNPDKKSSLSDEEMTVEIDDGVQIIVHKSDLILNGHRAVDPRELEYQQRAGGMDQSAETHYKVAGWCNSKGLKELAQAHYLRAIEINPDYNEARAAIEHRKSDSGRWIRVEDHMQRIGKVEVGSKWVYPEYALEDRQKAEEEKAGKERRKEIERFHQEFIRGGAKLDQTLAVVEQLDDHLAIEVFAEKLRDKVVQGRKPTPEPLKLVYVRLLSKFNNPIAFSALSRASVFDPSEAVRNAALDALLRNGRQQAIDFLRGLLNPKLSDNATINQAAYALGKLDASEAILDLINALVTRHEAARSQADTYSGEGLALGGPKTVVRDLSNEQVRNALSQITGQGNLGFDKAAWLAWYANRYASPVDDLRRDF